MAHPDVLQEVLEFVFEKCSAIQKEEIRYGWQKKSIGCSATLDGEAVWIRVHADSTVDSLVNGLDRLKAANEIRGVMKPIVHKTEVVCFEEKVFGVAFMSYIEEKTFSKTTNLEKEVYLSDNWFSSLKNQLNALGKTRTEYVSCRQDLIHRRIQEKYNGFPSKIVKWGTIHGDLNWGNITTSTPFFLDWEGWGTGPEFLDVFFLYAFSLKFPAVSQRIREYFCDLFQSDHAKICLLFVCSELIRMIEIHNDHPDLYEPLTKLAEEARGAWNN